MQSMTSSKVMCCRFLVSESFYVYGVQYIQIKRTFIHTVFPRIDYVITINLVYLPRSNTIQGKTK